MSDLIDRQALQDTLDGIVRDYIEDKSFQCNFAAGVVCDVRDNVIAELPAVDAVEVVRCQNCIHSEPLERNCELNSTVYMHCKIGRGEEEQNVWHKYKKYYRDYSLVDRDGYCDEGERMGDA